MAVDGRDMLRLATPLDRGVCLSLGTHIGVSLLHNQATSGSG
jgi:hypothetical protein